MPIQRARSLDDVYERVAEYDLVLAPDAPLADAIDRRVDRPQFGTFATTPRRLAAGRREGAEDRSAFLAVVERTDHGWKALADAVGNVLQCWEHQGRRDAILDYDAYVDDATEDVVECLGAVPTTSKRLSEYTVEADSVAVVGEPQLTELERSILPETYDSVALLGEEPFDHPPFHVFDGSAGVVDAICSTVDEASADDVAVVLDGGSRYSSLVEAALESAGVPYFGGPGFADQPHHRCFLSLCRTAFRGSGTTVADVEPVLARLGTDVGVEHAEKRLHAAELDATEWVRRFCAALEDRTFGEALEAYETRAGTALDRFREELAALGIAEAPVDRRALDELAYYLQSYDVPIDRENEGVLLADATSSGYVDRPVVFHVGLDEGWTESAPQRPWVDPDVQFDRSLRRFQLLLQSGVEQYYLVQDTAGGQPVTPCLYFSELLDVEYERFGDLDAVSYGHAIDGDGEGFDREPVDADAAPVETVSNSSLKRYVNCPRDYCFDRLLDGPDRHYFVEGTLFHDFAEFYVNHPERFDDPDERVGDGADGEGPDDAAAEGPVGGAATEGPVGDAAIEAVVDVLLEETEAFYAESELPLRRRRYRLGVETIAEYLDAYGPTDHEFLTPASGWGTNRFAELFDEPVDSPLAERWFENEALGLKGQIDLVRAPTHLVDWKSGSKQSEREVVRHAAIDPVDDAPDFQAALYCSHFRTVRPGERIEFTFCHFLETVDDLVRGDHELDDALTTVSYYPWTFDDHVGSPAAYEALLDGYNDCVATFEDLGEEAYLEIASQLSVPETADRDELRSSAFAEEFATAVDAATGDDVDAEKGCDQAIRLLDGVRRRSFFREDLDAFEAFVAERIETLNRQRAGEERFPVDRLDGGEPNYRRVEHRDLLLDGPTQRAGGQSGD